MGTGGRRVYLYWSFTLFLISVSLYSASAGVEQHGRQNITTQEILNGPGFLLFNPQSFIVGPFQLTGGGSTALIDSKCSIAFQNQANNVVITDNDQNQANGCDEFNAFRVLFAIAGVLALLSFILSMIAAFCSDGQCARISALIMGFISFSAGVASFAIYIDYNKNVKHHEEYLVGFWLHIAATGVSLIATFCAVPNPAFA